MTFLNPLLLVGLAAAAIPIIIHLLNLRKLKTIEFSSLHFLKELQRTKMRRVRIKQWLLLALRTLIIIALVIAFARPALKGSLAGTIGTEARSTIVVLLDDSPSMGIRNEQGLLFAQARDAASRIAGMLKDGDELYLLRLSETAMQSAFLPVPDAGTVTTALAEMAPTQLTVSYHHALKVAANILANSRNFNRELHLITDGQATQFLSRDSRSDTTQLLDERVKVFLTDLSGEQRDNVAITGIEVQSRILTPGKPASLLVTVRNFGQSPVRDRVMSIYLDGTRVVQHSLDIVAGGTSTTTTTVIPRRRGILQGYVQIEDDVMESDNRRHFIMNIPEHIQVLLAGSTTQDTRLPLLALTLGEDTAATGAFKVHRITGTQLASVDISRFDVLIMCGIRQFAPTVAERIAAFVRSGRGLILFPGRESDYTNYNEVLLPALGIPRIIPPMPLPEIVVEQGFLTFRRVDFAHPLFGGLFELPATGRQQAPEIESPRVFSAITPSSGSLGQTIIELSNGTGFLMEYPVDAGRVMMFSVEPGLQWSDFPVKAIFAPLMHRSVAYLASQSHMQSDLIAGDEINLHLRLRAGIERDAFTLRSPSGIEERMMPRFLAGSGMAVFSGTHINEVGVYELRSSRREGKEPGELLGAVAANLSPLESDLRRISDDDLRLFWEVAGISPGQVERLAGVERLEATVMGARFGVELWKYFVALALLCALVEMIIGRESKETTRTA